MRAAERHHIGDQPMRVMQPLIEIGRNQRVGMPAKGQRGLGHETISLIGGQPAIPFGRRDQGAALGGENVAGGQDARGLVPQSRIVDQVEPQQRGEDTERVTAQRRLSHRAEGGRMDRHPGLAEVVIADRIHPHHREQPAQHRQLARRADPDRTMPFQRDAVQLIGFAQLRCQFPVLRQHLGIGLGDQRQQRAIGRHLVAIHGRHCGRETGTDFVG